jgi:hypothetical protein
MHVIAHGHVSIGAPERQPSALRKAPVSHRSDELRMAASESDHPIECARARLSRGGLEPEGGLFSGLDRPVPRRIPNHIGLAHVANDLSVPDVQNLVRHVELESPRVDARGSRILDVHGSREAATPIRDSTDRSPPRTPAIMRPWSSSPRRVRRSWPAPRWRSCGRSVRLLVRAGAERETRNGASRIRVDPTRTPTRLLGKLRTLTAQPGAP